MTTTGGQPIFKTLMEANVNSIDQLDKLDNSDFESLGIKIGKYFSSMRCLVLGNPRHAHGVHISVPIKEDSAQLLA